MYLKKGVLSTWKALARARAPSFSRRFLPAMNTLSLSGAPCADDCLWHSMRASARIYTKRRYKSVMQVLFSSTLSEEITK